jgi:hypothetical protein
MLWAGWELECIMEVECGRCVNVDQLREQCMKGSQFLPLRVDSRGGSGDRVSRQMVSASAQGLTFRLSAALQRGGLALTRAAQTWSSGNLVGCLCLLLELRLPGQS